MQKLQCCLWDTPGREKKGKSAEFLRAFCRTQATSHLCFSTLYRGMKGTRMGTVLM